MSYKLTQNPSIVIRLADGASITGPSDSPDWLTYAAWLEAGGIPEAAVDIEQLKSMKSEGFSSECEVTILAGFPSSALGSAHWYDSDIHDQINILGATLAANSGQNVPYKCLNEASGEKTFVVHTPQQMMQVFGDGVTYKLTQLQKCALLQSQVAAATSIEDVNNINW